MKKLNRKFYISKFLIITCFLVFFALYQVPSDAHAPGVVLEGFTSTAPTIDGVIGAGEWSSADTASFSIGTLQATLYVMNDLNNLYLALSINDSDLDNTFENKDIWIVQFDDNHNGVIDEGEDMLIVNAFPFIIDSTSTHFADQYFTTDGGQTYDALYGGTNDGSGNVSRVSGRNHFELSHPLCSADTTHDFCLRPGDTAGFNILYAESSNFLPSWPGSVALGPGNPAVDWGDIIIGSSEDIDGDGIPNATDNCPLNYNPGQEDLGDGDGAGDVCDNCRNKPNPLQEDDDGDGAVCVDWLSPNDPNYGCGNKCDNCRNTFNPNQGDNDRVCSGTPPVCVTVPDGIGDSCDNCPNSPNSDQRDDDRDGRGNVCDNCLTIPNPGQENSDTDEFGDVCDNCPNYPNPDQRDRDEDGLGNACDNCPGVSNPGQEDLGDGDGVGDVCDNCPSTANRDQANHDEDSLGDACDNCPWVSNLDQADQDRDGRGNVCDNCLTIPNPGQEDSDFDSVGNVCDNCWYVRNSDQSDSLDTDCDWLPKPYTSDPHCGDTCDNCPSIENPEQTDRDRDSLGDACDNCPDWSNAGQDDIDRDGVGDGCDCDDVLQGENEAGIDCGGPCPACLALPAGWRNVTPIRLRGASNSGFIDVVFVPEESYRLNYSRFLQHIIEAIRYGYFELHNNTIHPIPANYKDRFNFYYYTGGFGGPSTSDHCSGTLPRNFWRDAPGADTAAILTTTWAGCANTLGPPSQFIAEGRFPNLIIHESGHAIFSLVDEYCGKTYYTQNNPKPNVWSSLRNCQNDAAAEGWTRGSCRQIQWDDPTTPGLDCSKSFWRYDPDVPFPDYMTACGPGCIAAYQFWEADARRINYTFDNWPAGRSKGLLVNFHIDKEGKITEQGSEVVNGHPDLGLQWEVFRAEILSSGGEILQTYGIWDPRIEFGLQGGPGLVYSEEADFHLIFPFHPNIKTFKILDSETGEEKISIDLSDTLHNYCSQLNYQDPDCQTLDLDNDGVLDYRDRCLGTILPENVPEWRLLPWHYANVDDDRIFETAKIVCSQDTKGYKKCRLEILNSKYKLVDTYGCSCEQILEYKPGKNIGERKFGCTEGTIKTWISQKWWASK